MNIKQLREMPNNCRVGGFDLAIKTAKKKWETKEGWIHQVVLMDKTHEIWADVNIGKNIPLIAGKQIHIIVCEVQDSEHLNKSCKKLYVDQFTQPTQIGEPPMDFEYGDSVKIIRSKILCLLTAAKIEAGASTSTTLDFLNNPELNQIVDKIMEG